MTNERKINTFEAIAAFSKLIIIFETKEEPAMQNMISVFWGFFQSALIYPILTHFDFFQSALNWSQI